MMVEITKCFLKKSWIFSFVFNSQMTLHKIYFLNFSREIYIVRHINHILPYYSQKGIFLSVPETATIFKGFFWFRGCLLINQFFEGCSTKSGEELGVEP